MRMSEEQVFVSHTWSDKEFVRRLGADLKRHNVRIWVDEWEMKVGDSLVEKIERAIGSSGYLIIVLSPEAVASRWVRVELNASLMQQVEHEAIRILPVLYRECTVPLLLRERIYADFRQSYEAGLASLLRVFLPKHNMRETVFVPAGIFEYGFERTERNVPYGFEMDVYPVTVADFVRFVRDTGYEHPYYRAFNDPIPVERASLPARWVNVEDALAYCQWRSTIEGRRFRLPLEEEWEKASRGTDGRDFPWGNEAKYHWCNCREYNYLERQGLLYPTAVDHFPRNVSPFGCRDMAGNVMEWTGSEYLKGPGVGREVRGGSWGNDLKDARCAAAYPHFDCDRSDYVGFRCVSAPDSIT